MGEHETAVDEYLSTYTKLSKTHPVLVGLRVMARELDSNFRTTLAQSYQMTMRYLEKLENAEGDEDGDLDLFKPLR